MKLKLLVAAIALAATGAANAFTVTNWSSYGTDTFVATVSGGGTHVNLSDAISFNGGNLGVGSGDGVFSLTADSTGTATNVSGIISQLFSGTFDLYDTGGAQSIIHGSFTNAKLSDNSGSILFGISSNNGTLTFASDFLNASQLDVGRVLNLTFSDVSGSGDLAISGGTIAAFSGSYSGTASSKQSVIHHAPEPETLFLAGLGLLGVVASRRAKKA